MPGYSRFHWFSPKFSFLGQLQLDTFFVTKMIKIKYLQQIDYISTTYWPCINDTTMKYRWLAKNKSFQQLNIKSSRKPFFKGNAYVPLKFYWEPTCPLYVKHYNKKCSFSLSSYRNHICKKSFNLEMCIGIHDHKTNGRYHEDVTC